LRFLFADESTKNAKELGAQIFVPPTDIPKMGRFAIVGDPTSAAIGLFAGAM
jgi:predicted enzyme related to lactoylglutathione lyase